MFHLDDKVGRTFSGEKMKLSSCLLTLQVCRRSTCCRSHEWNLMRVREELRLEGNSVLSEKGGAR